MKISNYIVRAYGTGAGYMTCVQKELMLITLMHNKLSLKSYKYLMDHSEFSVKLLVIYRVNAYIQCIL